MSDYERVQSLNGWDEIALRFEPEFVRGLLFVLAHEIVWGKAGVLTEHDPRDRGGVTKWGIDQRSHPKEDIASLTLSEAADIYHREWRLFSCPMLPEPLAIAHFDGAVNQGEHASAQQLQAGLGVVADGKLGPISLAAALNPPDGALDRMLAARESRYQTLRQFDRYGKGWMNRVKDLREYLA